MSLLGNIIWLVFGGFLSGLGYIVGGLSLCATIIGILLAFKLSKLGLRQWLLLAKKTLLLLTLVVFSI